MIYETLGQIDFLTFRSSAPGGQKVHASFSLKFEAYKGSFIITMYIFT
jgi:hypothetical protein